MLEPSDLYEDEPSDDDPVDKLAHDLSEAIQIMTDIESSGPLEGIWLPDEVTLAAGQAAANVIAAYLTGLDNSEDQEPDDLNDALDDDDDLENYL